MTIFKDGSNMLASEATSPGNRTVVIHHSGHRGAAGQMESITSHIIDSPNTTSQITYDLRVEKQTSTIYINMSGDDPTNNSASYPRGVSTFTCMEIGA